MVNKSFYIERSFTGDLEELRNLFLTEYSSNDPICNYHHLKWQYEFNPHGAAIITCAREHTTNKLVGVYIVNPLWQWLHGEKVLAALSLNTFTHKEHRGQGMFTALADACYEISKERNIQYIIGFPNRMSYGGFVMKLGFANLGSIDYLIKPLNYLNLIKNFLLKSLVFPDLSSIISENHKQIIKVDKESLNKMDSFFEQHRKVCHYQTYRSSAHYKWRFFDNPTHKYRIFAQRGLDNRISSVLVIKEISSITDDIQIVDFCCLDELSGTVIIKFLLSVAKTKFSMVRVFAQPKTLESLVLAKLGFFKKDTFLRNKGFLPFIYKDLRNNDKNIPFKKWHISMADTDVV